MAFLLDPIESGIDSLLAPLTSTPSAATSADEIVPIETSISSQSKSTATSKTASRSSTAVSTSTLTQDSATTSTRSRSTSSPEPTSTSSAETTSTTEDPTSTSSTSIATSLSTSTTASTSSSMSTSTTISTSLSTPAAPSAPAQPSLSPAQSTTDSTSQSSNSGTGLSTTGIAIACVFAAALLISIIWLTVRFCPPVRNRVDAWYERRREERTYRAALDGAAIEKGSLSSDSTSSIDSSRPFSFFALGKNLQLQGSDTNTRLPLAPGTNGTTYNRQSYIPPTSADPITPTSARPRESLHGHGLGLGRVSLLRNTSLLRKAGFDAPPSLPSPQHLRPLQLPLSISTTTSSANPQTPNSIKPTPSQLKRKPLPAHPQSHPQSHPPHLDTPRRHSRFTPFPSSISAPPSTSPSTILSHRSLLPAPLTHTKRNKRTTDSIDAHPPRLQIMIPRIPGGLSDVERVSQIGLAVTGSPAGRR